MTNSEKERIIELSKQGNGYLNIATQFGLYSDKIKDTFNESVILNNYEDFMKRTYYISMGKLKE